MSITEADNYLWNEALNSESDNRFIFEQKQRLYVQDQSTGGIYNGQIQYDLSSLSNSGLYTDLSSAVLQIPYVVSCKSDDAADALAITKNFITMKSNYVNLIDQLQVDVNNKTVCNSSQNINVLANFKMLTTFDQSSLEKLGPSLMFAPDSNTTTHSAAASENGQFYINNGTSNLGLVSRRNLVEDAAVGTVPTVGGTTAERAATLSSEARNYHINNGLTTADKTFHWIFMASIRLKDLSSFFEMPLARGLNMRLLITYNSFKFDITSTAVSPSLLSIASYQQTSGSTCPIMFSQPTNLSNIESVISVTGNVVSNYLSTGVADISLPFNSTRLYIDCYKLNPEYRSILLKIPSTTYQYLDYYSYPISSTVAKNSFNQIVSNGIPHVRAVIIIPFAPKDTNNTHWQSPWDSAPSTTLAGGAISNLNILIGGVNQFSQNQTYTFENYMSELQHIFAVNGGKSDSVNCGLVSKRNFENNYRYYCCSIRRPASEDSIPKSVQITGTNNTAVAVEYTVIVLYEKSITLNTHTGEILNTIP